MAIIGQPLFYRQDRIDLDTMLRRRLENYCQTIDGLPAGLISSKKDEEIIAGIIAQARINPLEVDYSQAIANVEETIVERHDQFQRGRIFRVPGLEATKKVPFKGDASLWTLRPNTYTLDPPHGQIEGQTLIIGISVPTDQAEEAKTYLDQTLAKIPEYLERQKTQIEAYHNGLAAQLQPRLQQRRSRLDQASDLLKKIQG